MIKNTKELSSEELENVTGGTGETFDMEHMQDYFGWDYEQEWPLISEIWKSTFEKGEGQVD